MRFLVGVVPTRHANDLAAELEISLARIIRHIAEPLNRRRRLRDIDAQLSERFVERANHAVPRRFGSPERSAAADGFARDKTGKTAVMQHFKFIEHPQHMLTVRHHIGRGHVHVGAHIARKRAHPCAAKALLFRRRKLARIAVDPAFAAAQRNIDNRTLPCHPRRKRAHRVDRFARIKPDAAFAGAAAVVVLHAITPKHAHRPVVHANRQTHRMFAHRHAKQRPDALA